ncbi:MAG: TIGR04084 family radical SAM/SPASM domain-containing protein [Candidatus Heimdallarchaeota archaeon]|nr:TIGR04084 family radical SAM/SPASM domain-containing protein [Candidatus Heimdallarchaeota archaeon]
MNYFVILTRACNLKCKYCGEDSAFEQPPIDLAFPIEDLRSFIAKDDSSVSIQFYGGEPLLKVSFLEDIMDTLENVKYWSIQTNGLLLHKLKPEYLQRLNSILVSIDGRQEITDTNRGIGVYDKVLKNCRYIQNNGFTGDLVARMAISEIADIFKEVTHLAELQSPHFDHIHWQIDSQWDDHPHARWIDFEKWMVSSYNPGITRLIQWWYRNLTKGKFYGIVPFIPILKSILFDQSSTLRCGAGLDSFAINPDGRISVCPISPEFNFSLVGDIWKSTPNSLRNSLKILEPCPSCIDYPICGGRCLFINHTKLWGEQGFNTVCQTVKHLISELKNIKNPILNLISNDIITEKVFDYPSFNNGCEIIP